MTTLMLIGFGRWGKKYYHTIKQMPSVEIVCVCVHRKTSEAPDDIPVFTNYKNVSLEKIDGVIIATPPRKHFSIARYFLERKKPVLIEKPMVTTLTQAENLKLLYEKSKTIAMVGHIFLFNKGFENLLSQKKKLGKIIAIESEGYANGPVRKDVSALWDWGAHDISMMIKIIKSLPVSVCARAISLDNQLPGLIYIYLQFPQKIQAFIKTGWIETEKKRRLVVFANKKTAVFNDLDIIQNPSPLENEIAAFCAAIKTKKKPESDISFGTEVIRVLSCIQRSLNINGKTIKIS